MFERTSTDVGHWLKHGLIGGLLAGLVLGVFEVVAAAIMNGTQTIVTPLYAIGAILIGSVAIGPAYSLATDATAGILFYALMCALSGVVFGAIAASVYDVASSRSSLIASASAFGMVLWGFNFNLISSLAPFLGLPIRTNMVVQFIGLTVFFGAVLGIYLSAVSRPTGQVIQMEHPESGTYQRAA
jgi:hypothetical protein